MPSSVSEKVAFVTGGASGIGAALTSKLAIELDVRDYPAV
jgi:NAD(P)-dependent dehydrogenase (short-subunit alcohol dehydrogenase family)